MTGRLMNVEQLVGRELARESEVSPIHNFYHYKSSMTCFGTEPWVAGVESL
jgi:hypothetical protein